MRKRADRKHRLRLRVLSKSRSAQRNSLLTPSRLPRSLRAFQKTPFGLRAQLRTSPLRTETRRRPATSVRGFELLHLVKCGSPHPPSPREPVRPSRLPTWARRPTEGPGGWQLAPSREGDEGALQAPPGTVQDVVELGPQRRVGQKVRSPVDLFSGQREGQHVLVVTGH